MSDSITGSEKSWVKSFVERAKGEAAIVPVAAASAVAPYASATGGVAVGYGEAAIVGGLLGTTRAMFGNDAADAAAASAAGLAALASIAIAGTHPTASQHIRNVGLAATAIFSDRKAEALVGGKRGGGGAPSPAHGESDDDGNGGADPVAAAGKRL